MSLIYSACSMLRPGKKALPDEIARASPCPDFACFAPLFETRKRACKAKSFLVRYRNEHGFQVGDFHLNGVMGIGVLGND